MLSPDVIELREFYAGELGRTVSRILRQRVEHWWPEAPGDTVLGIGYPTPYLEEMSARSDVTAVLMPAGQGAAYWPVGSANVTLLGDEADLPFADTRVNRVLIVHMLENSEHLRRMLKEIWRVLAPGGRVLTIVPNRRGIWARSPKSPFAHGQPFSQRQLRGVFADTDFTVLRCVSALHFPPLSVRPVLRSAEWWERISTLLFPAFGGVILLEAEKQIYATSRDTVKAARGARLYAKPVTVAAGRQVPS